MQSASMTDVRRRDARHALLPLALFGVIAFLVGADLASDWNTERAGSHLLLESLAGALALLGLAVLIVHTRALHRWNDDLGNALLRCEHEGAHHRERAQAVLEGLAATLERTFTAWDLTPAEREVAVLLLEGRSHKEIAVLRNTEPGTVRQQALSVYRKSGVDGRASLAAVFIQDMLARGPEVARPASTVLVRGR
jgi:DNA-binding CsgD family transcriptional regulator